MFLQHLAEYARQRAGNRVVADVRIGLCYTAALLDDGSAGVAYTFKESVPHGCDVFQGVRPISGKSAFETFVYLSSPNVLERAVGIAAANAVINKPHEALIAGDILEVLNLQTHDRVGMVGLFAPLVSPLKKLVKDVLIFEKVRKELPEIYEEETAYELLPTCSIAIITATTLINNTLYRLLGACKNCRDIALVGATTPFAPEIFKPFGITLLSGILITNPHGILRQVSEGGGMGSFKGFISKVNLRIK